MGDTKELPQVSTTEEKKRAGHNVQTQLNLANQASCPLLVVSEGTRTKTISLTGNVHLFVPASRTSTELDECDGCEGLVCSVTPPK